MMVTRVVNKLTSVVDFFFLDFVRRTLLHSDFQGSLAFVFFLFCFVMNRLNGICDYYKCDVCDMLDNYIHSRTS